MMLSSGAQVTLGALRMGESEQPIDDLVWLIDELRSLDDEAALLDALAALMGASPRGQRARALSSERAQREVNERFGAALSGLALAKPPRVMLEVARILRRHPDLAARELYMQVEADALAQLLGALRDEPGHHPALRLGGAALTKPLPMPLVLALCEDEAVRQALDATLADDLITALVERRPGLGEEAAHAEEDLGLIELVWPRLAEQARATALARLRDRIEIERSHREGDMHRGSQAPALSALSGEQAARLCALLWAPVGADAQQERALVLQLLMIARLPLDPKQALSLLASPNRDVRKVALRALLDCVEPGCADALLVLRTRISAAERETVDGLIRRIGRDPSEQVAHSGGLSALGQEAASGGLEIAGAQSGDLSEIGEENSALSRAPGWRGELTGAQRAWLSAAPPPRGMSWGLTLRLMLLGTGDGRLLFWMLATTLAGGSMLVGIGAAVAMAGVFALSVCGLVLLDLVLWTSTLVQSLRRAPIMLMPIVQVHRTWRGPVVEVESDRGRRALRLPRRAGVELNAGDLIPVMWSHRSTLHTPMQVAGIAVRPDGQLTVRRDHAALSFGIAALGALCALVMIAMTVLGLAL